MSVTALPLQPLKRGSIAKFWIALALFALLAGLAAWLTTNRFQVITTPTGVRIQTIAAGEGEPIGFNDGVLINYTGRLEDGTVFDSTDEAGGPAPMLVQRVVPGFGEALRNMRQGGSYRIWIPPEQAYGSTPPPGAPIPPNATLEFDVEVVQVARDAALQLAMPPGAMPSPQGGGGHP